MAGGNAWPAVPQNEGPTPISGVDFGGAARPRASPARHGHGQSRRSRSRAGRGNAGSGARWRWLSGEAIPQLGCMHAQCLGFFGVGVPCGRAVIRLTWPEADDLPAAQAVAVQYLSLDHPGESLQADVRMGPNLHCREEGTAAGPAWSEAPGPAAQPRPEEWLSVMGMPPTSAAIRVGRRCSSFDSLMTNPDGEVRGVRDMRVYSRNQTDRMQQRLARKVITVRIQPIG